MKIIKHPTKRAINHIRWIKRQLDYWKHKGSKGSAPYQDETIEGYMERSGQFFYYVEDKAKGNISRGWSFLPKQQVNELQHGLNRDWRLGKKGYSVITPRRDVVIIYRQPGAKVFLVEEPRIPPFAAILHHHGSQSAPVDEEFKCIRCGIEVPQSIKSVAMLETTMGVMDDTKKESK